MIHMKHLKVSKFINFLIMISILMPSLVFPEEVQQNLRHNKILQAAGRTEQTELLKKSQEEIQEKKPEVSMGWKEWWNTWKYKLGLLLSLVPIAVYTYDTVKNSLRNPRPLTRQELDRYILEVRDSLMNAKTYHQVRTLYQEFLSVVHRSSHDELYNDLNMRRIESIVKRKETEIKTHIRAVINYCHNHPHYLCRSLAAGAVLTPEHDINLNSGYILFIEAMDHHDLTFAQLLLRVGVNIDKQIPWANFFTGTYLMRVVKEIYELIPDSPYRASPIISSQIHQLYGKLDFLLKNGAQINASNRDGTTALLYVVANLRGSKKIPSRNYITPLLIYLLAHGANPLIKRKAYKTQNSIEILEEGFNNSAEPKKPFFKEYLEILKQHIPQQRHS